MDIQLPIVAIVGRPNVGKSTLFNAIIGERRAIVEDEPGVTRDRNYGLSDRYEFPFFVVDTGGFEKNPSDEMSRQVVEQTVVAVEEADVVIALFDGNVSVQAGDADVVELLRKSGKPVIYGVNKCDGVEHSYKAAEFYSLGLKAIQDLSALHGQGVRALMSETLQSLPNYKELVARAQERAAAEADAELAMSEELKTAEIELARATAIAEAGGDEEEILDADSEETAEQTFAPVFVPGETEGTPDDYVRAHGLKELPARREYYSHFEEEAGAVEEVDELSPERRRGPAGDGAAPKVDVIRVAIVGRPNAGKSTFVNTLYGEERAITSPVAGTTRDTLDLAVEHGSQKFVIVDTAGLRRKGRISDKIERYSTLRALSAMNESDVCVLLIDGALGPSEQDSKIAGLAHEYGKGLILGVNKWDLVKKDHKTVREYTEQMRETFKFAKYAPIVFLSARSGRRCRRVLEIAQEIAQERLRRISTGPLNQMLKKESRRYPAPMYRGEPARIIYASQVDVAPPTFVLFFNQVKGLNFTYLRFLRNVIREKFGFDGTDIKLLPKKRGETD